MTVALADDLSLALLNLRGRSKGWTAFSLGAVGEAWALAFESEPLLSDPEDRRVGFEFFTGRILLADFETPNDLRDVVQGWLRVGASWTARVHRVYGNPNEWQFYIVDLPPPFYPAIHRGRGALGPYRVSLSPGRRVIGRVNERHPGNYWGWLAWQKQVGEQWENLEYWEIPLFEFTDPFPLSPGEATYEKGTAGGFTETILLDLVEYMSWRRVIERETYSLEETVALRNPRLFEGALSGATGAG